MSSFLSRVTKGKTVKPRATVVYGTGGVGKSTFASCAPAPVFLPTEDGTGDIDTERGPLLTSYDEVLAAIGELYNEPHEYKTAVLDSADWFERLIWAKVCAEHSVQNIEDIGYAKGYTFALDHWRNALAGFDALRRDRGMAIIVLAHSKVEKFEAPDAPSYDRYSIKLNKHAGPVLVEWADEVLFATRKTMTVTTEEGFKKTRTRALSPPGGEKRVLYTTETASHVAKNRLDLPAELPLLWSAYAEHFTPTKASI